MKTNPWVDDLKKCWNDGDSLESALEDLKHDHKLCHDEKWASELFQAILIVNERISALRG